MPQKQQQRNRPQIFTGNQRKAQFMNLKNIHIYYNKIIDYWGISMKPLREQIWINFYMYLLGS